MRARRRNLIPVRLHSLLNACHPVRLLFGLLWHSLTKYNLIVCANISRHELSNNLFLTLMSMSHELLDRHSMSI